MKIRHTRARARRGHTLLEVAIAGLLLALLFGAVALAATRSNEAYQSGMSSAIVGSQAQRLLDRVASEFLDADRSSVSATVGTASLSTLDYARPTGLVAGALAFGPTRRIDLMRSASESADGIDNDSNGLVDECRLVLVADQINAPADFVELGSGVRDYLEGEVPNGLDDNGNGLVDERGFCATFNDVTNTLTLRLTIERAGNEGQLVTRTAQTSILLRND